MLQIVQYQKTGELIVEHLPEPQLQSGGVLVQNIASLISAGTERTSIETAQASMVGKARKRPDLVKQVQDNIRREGLIATYKKVQNRLDSYKELGYSSAGVVLESSLPEFRPGDRVACAGGGYASHAERIFVPKNLVSKIPEKVTFEEAAFTTLGSIALHGVRQADVRIGEKVAVIGLGLVGLLTVQMLKAAGCRIVGVDILESNFQIAQELGCDACFISDDKTVDKISDYTENRGTDAVLITASSPSNSPTELAMNIARRRSKVVYIGFVGMNLPRSLFYEKELDVKISCSYGPGRYDSDYEEGGNDYPIDYVRWTENRNMEAVLSLLEQKKLNVIPLITHRFPIDDALKAYDLVTGMEKEKYLGIIVQYPVHESERQLTLQLRPEVTGSGAKPVSPVIGFIGAGNFAQSHLLPPLKKLKATLSGLATRTPINAKTVAKKFDFNYCTTDPIEILNDNGTDTIFIATRHDSHSKYVIDALHSKKNVYVEKPLAVTEEELREIVGLYNRLNDKGLHTYLMVGYNRRFSKPIMDIKDFFSSCDEPLVMYYRVNAGFIPRDHWYQAEEQQGRIIGEACHFVDTMQYLTDAVPTEVFCQTLLDVTNKYFEDNASITLTFSDGSIGVVTYLANGARNVRKEFLEVFGSGQTAVMDDFRKVSFYSDRKKQTVRYRGDKGHVKEMQAVVESLCSGSRAPISFESLLLTTISTLMAVSSARTGEKKLITL